MKNVVPRPTPAGEESRRDFLTGSVAGLVGLAVAVSALFAGFVGFKSLRPAGKKGVTVRGDQVAFPRSDLSDGGIRTVLIKGRPVGVIETAGELRAFSLICSHLGCIVSWQTDRKTFLCPCHASQYDAEGSVLTGPAPRPLFPVKIRVEGETVVVG